MQEYYFGDWLREQRKRFDLTQKDLSLKTNGEISQSVISMWENKEVEIPSLNNILIILRALNLSFKSVPFDHFKIIEKGKDESYLQRSDNLSERFSLYELPDKANSIKTFCGKTYKVKGFVGVETDTGEVKNIADLYYDVRSVVDCEDNLTAKRKNKSDELTKLKKKKKVSNGN